MVSPAGCGNALNVRGADSLSRKPDLSLMLSSEEQGMDSVEIVLAMLLAVVASGYLVRVLPFSLPLPLAQIAMGVVVEAAFNHGVTLDPQIFFLLFLPPLLFLDGWRIPKLGLLRDKAVILQLALGLVVFTVLGAGFLIHWLIPAIPLPVAFALAAIVSPTDPVAVSSIAARVPIPTRLMRILEGEALLNDATGLVCFRFALAAALTGEFSLASAALTFLWVALAGLAIGAAVTRGVSLAQHWLARRFGEASGSPILINLLIPFGAYLMAESLHASGILAAVSAGITMSYVELGGRALATTRVQRAAVWDTVQFALDGIMFVLLGEQLPGILRAAGSSARQAGLPDPWWLAVYALAISLGLALLRFSWVWVSLRLTLFRQRLRGQRAARPDWRLVLATTLAGVRGAITLAGVMSLPLLMPDGAPFPARDLAILLASAVILVSLVMASVALPRLLKGLEVPEDTADQLEQDRARYDAAKAAIGAVEKAGHELRQAGADAGVCADAAAHVTSLYQRRLDDGAGGAGEAGKVRETDQLERALRLAALQAERQEILKQARLAKISDETARKLVREIDLLESRYH
jgi:Na+/H+ antiporter